MMRLGSYFDLEKIITEMFWEWFDDEFVNQNPDNTSDSEYKHLFDKFWDDLYWDIWKTIENKCSDRHYAIYEPIYDENDENDDWEDWDTPYEIGVGK